MSKVLYTRITHNENICSHCLGRKLVYEKQYHNQWEEVKCFHCQDGKQINTKVEDATDFVLVTIRQNEDYNKKFAAQQKLIRELESKLITAVDTIEQMKKNHKSRKEILDKTREKLRNMTSDCASPKP